MNEALKRLEALLSNAAAVPSRFPPSSRYNSVPTLALTSADGRAVAYVARRFVPPTERFAVLREHPVVDGDRLDLLAARYLGDAEQWWKLADANGAMRPEELTETPGLTLRIALPDGFTGGSGGT